LKGALNQSGDFTITVKNRGERFPEPIAMVDWTAAGDAADGVEEIVHYLHDSLGNIVGLTDEGNPGASPPVPGKLVERYAYDPYGKPQSKATILATAISQRHSHVHRGRPAGYPPICGRNDGQYWNSGTSTWQTKVRSEFNNPFLWTGQRYDAGGGVPPFPPTPRSRSHLLRWLPQRLAACPPRRDVVLIGGP
jgi:hypothetical protein